MLTRFLWRLHVVTKLVFNGCVIGEGLGDSWCRTVKGKIVSTLFFPGVVWFDS